eukprot:6551726-Karenia_brevis.AAC.1
MRLASECGWMLLLFLLGVLRSSFWRALLRSALAASGIGEANGCQRPLFHYSGCDHRNCYHHRILSLNSTGLY